MHSAANACVMAWPASQNKRLKSSVMLQKSYSRNTYLSTPLISSRSLAVVCMNGQLVCMNGHGG